MLPRLFATLAAPRSFSTMTPIFPPSKAVSSLRYFLNAREDEMRNDLMSVSFLKFSPIFTGASLLMYNVGHSFCSGDVQAALCFFGVICSSAGIIATMLNALYLVPEIVAVGLPIRFYFSNLPRRIDALDKHNPDFSEVEAIIRRIEIWHPKYRRDMKDIRRDLSYDQEMRRKLEK